MPSQKAKRELTFEQSLETLGVKRSFDALVREGIDPKILEGMLSVISSSPNKYTPSSSNRRMARLLPGKVERLAKAIERANQSLPILLIRDRSLLASMQRLPKELRTYASFWEKFVAVPLPHAASPRTEMIAALLELVKYYTRKYHYAEVADLLNVTEESFRKGNVRWNEGSLKQLHHRAKKRAQKLLKIVDSSTIGTVPPTK